MDWEAETTENLTFGEQLELTNAFIAPGSLKISYICETAACTYVEWTSVVFYCYQPQSQASFFHPEVVPVAAVALTLRGRDSENELL